MERGWTEGERNFVVKGIKKENSTFQMQTGQVLGLLFVAWSFSAPHMALQQLIK